MKHHANGNKGTHPFFLFNCILNPFKLKHASFKIFLSFDVIFLKTIIYSLKILKVQRGWILKVDFSGLSGSIRYLLGRGLINPQNPLKSTFRTRSQCYESSKSSLFALKAFLVNTHIYILNANFSMKNNENSLYSHILKYECF